MASDQEAGGRPPDRGRKLWAVVLAGGEGVRLRPLVQHLYGDGRPKQFAALIGRRSLLGHTLDRVGLEIPPERTVIVTRRSHAQYAVREVAGPAGFTILAQPDDRGTAAGVLLPAHWIQWRDPNATIAVFPSDHFIAEESVFMEHVVRVAAGSGVARESSSSWGRYRPGPILPTGGLSPATSSGGRGLPAFAGCGASWRSLPRRLRARAWPRDGSGTPSSSWRPWARLWKPAAATCLTSPPAGADRAVRGDSARDVGAPAGLRVSAEGELLAGGARALPAGARGGAPPRCHLERLGHATASARQPPAHGDRARVALHQEHGPALGGPFRVDWTVERSVRGTPAVSGYVYNNGLEMVRHVQLLVEVLDASDRVSARTHSWVTGDISPGGRAFFFHPLPALGSSYRVDVVSYQRLGRGP